MAPRGGKSGSRAASAKPPAIGARSAEHAALILRSLEEGRLDRDQVLGLMRAQGGHCSEPGPRGSLKQTPGCLCGLVPPVGASRKRGLWASNSAEADALGCSQDFDRREDPRDPAGLVNQANTCYVNAALQVLYAVPRLRDAIFRARFSQGDGVAETVRQVFLEMAYSPLGVVDTKELVVAALKLDPSVQQDGQEFMKLFLSLLEKSFEGDPVFKDVVTQVFGGRQSYTTLCKGCNQLSSSSRDTVDFLDLSLQVKDCDSIEDSLGRFTAPSFLDGDNKYLCEGCNARCDAVRRTVLRGFPPILVFTLERFAFDLQTLNKVKVKSPYEFPLELDMSRYLREANDILGEGPCNSMASYELMSIVHHIGSTAHQGHYVTQVKDTRGTWWLLNDDKCTSIGAKPTGDPEGYIQGSVSKKKRKLAQDGRMSSSSVYMLVYAQQGWGMHACSASLEELPASLAVQVEKMKADVEDRCTQRQEARISLERGIEDRQKFVREVIGLCAIDSSDTQDRWISTEWLQKWADAAAGPVKIDSTQLLCQHNKLDALKAHMMKRISHSAWCLLHERYGGGPELSTQDVCHDCIAEHCHQRLREDRASDRRGHFLELAKELEKRDSDASSGFYVSRQWLVSWKRKQGRGCHKESPTASITCEHGSLCPDSVARRVVLPDDFWCYLKECCSTGESDLDNTQSDNGQDDRKPSSPAHQDTIEIDIVGQPDDLAASTCSQRPVLEPESAADVDMVGLNKDKEIVAFPVCSASECELCVAKMNGERDRLQTEQELIKGVRSSLSRLLLPNTASQLEEGPTYYLVPADWMLMWRQWVNTKGKMHSGMPITLNDAMSNLLCRCGTHTPGLAIEVPAVHSIRGRWSVSHDAVELATDDEWRLLCSFHSKGQCDAVTCKLEVRTERASQEDQEEGPETKKLAGDGSKPSRTMPTSSTPELIISPEPCQAHLTQPFTKERFEVLEMADESMVLSAKPGGRRKRSRSEASIKISSADNLKHVKLLIFEALGIPVPNQRVFVHARELMRDDDSMEDAGLRIGTLMYVVNTHAVSDHDMSWLDVEIGRSMGAPIGVEMGFKNTALQGIF